MNKNSYSKNVWKYLMSQLSYEQKIEIIKDKDLKLGNMQPKLLTNNGQWKIVVKLFETNCAQVRIKKAITSYYKEQIVPELSNDMKNKDKQEELDKILNMQIKDFKKVIKDYGYMYILIFLVLNENLEKANEIIENIPNIILKEEKNEIIFINNENIVKLEIYEKENQILIKKNKNLTDKIEKQKVMLQELGKNNKIILDQMKLNESKHDRELNILTKKIEEYMNRINSLIMEKNKQEDIAEIRQHRIKELEEEKEELFEQIKGQEKFELPENISFETKKSSLIKVLVFGDLPFTAIRQNQRFTFSYFTGDYLNYDFNDSYQEYWYVIDKLSMREKRQLEKNDYAKKIAWVKKTYNGEMKKHKSEGFSL